MTVTIDRPTTAAPVPAEPRRATGLLGWLTTTDHKKIGISYMVTAFGFFMLGGALAEIMRLELFSPGRAVRRARARTTRSSRCTAAS